MCIIAHCEKRKLTEKEFNNCWDNNEDGFGIGWRDGETYKYKKGFMKLKDAWDFYKSFTKLPHTCHFRITSTGKTVKELTHPFTVSPQSPIRLKYSGKSQMLFHNGTISDWERFGMSHFLKLGKIPDGPMSDTRVAAMLVSQLGDKAIDYFSGKFVLWSDRVWLYGKFEEEDGIYFSNSDYRYKKWSSSGSNYYSNSNYKGSSRYNSHETFRNSLGDIDELEAEMNELDKEFEEALEKDGAFSHIFCTCEVPEPWMEGGLRSLFNDKLFEGEPELEGVEYYCSECGLYISVPKMQKYKEELLKDIVDKTSGENSDEELPLSDV